MKDVIVLTKRFLFLYLISILFISLFGCSNQPDKLEIKEMPADFNFSLIYGTYGKQKIDTFNETVVKDLVEDGTIEVKISFTEEEMEQIYHEMMSIDIMDDSKFTVREEEVCETEPPSYTIWNIQMDGMTNSFYTQNYCDGYPEDVLKLLKLADYIHSILLNKEEYKELPDSNGYYG